MNRSFQKISALVMAALLCAGCGSNADSSAGQQAGEISYSNLADSASQKEIVNILEDCGVTQEQTDELCTWADDFNQRIQTIELPEGFVPVGKDGNDYSKIIVEIKESDSGEILPEANCRLTANLLMKNLIHTNKKQEPDDTVLVFDTEAIDTCEQFHLSEEEKANFITLFNWVPVEENSTLQDHIAKIQNAWKDREIVIEGEGISLITVYLHSTFDNVRFVGHTGVLLDTEEGLMFVEKYGPIAPFQATKFQNREELKKYLLARPDLYGEETELKPIIMENDKVI